MKKADSGIASSSLEDLVRYVTKCLSLLPCRIMRQTDIYFYSDQVYVCLLLSYSDVNHNDIDHRERRHREWWLRLNCPGTLYRKIGTSGCPLYQTMWYKLTSRYSGRHWIRTKQGPCLAGKIKLQKAYIESKVKMTTTGQRPFICFCLLRTINNCPGTIHKHAYFNSQYNIYTANSFLYWAMQAKTYSIDRPGLEPIPPDWIRCVCNII